MRTIRGAHALGLVLLTGTFLACEAPSGGGGIEGTDPAADPGAEPTATTSQELLSRGSKVFGLGVDADKAVVSPLFAQLKEGWKAKDGYALESARTVFTITGDETAYEAARTGLESWAQTVSAYGLTPVVAIGVTRNGLNHQTYRARFRDLLGALPEVEAWAMVNEPDLNGFAGKDGVADAIEYYEDGLNVLDEEQKHGVGRGVLIWAGEFSYQALNGGQLKFSEKYWEDYTDRMFDELKARHIPQIPRVWGFHPYWDTTRGNTEGTQRLGDALAKLEAKAHLPKDTLRIWATETGTMLEWGQPNSELCNADSGDAKAQFDGARAIYGIAANKRVDRVYWWQFQQAECAWGGYWDSGMVDWNGAPRPAFCALANAPQSTCTGMDVSRDCGGVGRGNCPQ